MPRPLTRWRANFSIGTTSAFTIAVTSSGRAATASADYRGRSCSPIWPSAARNWACASRWVLTSKTRPSTAMLTWFSAPTDSTARCASDTPNTFSPPWTSGPIDSSGSAPPVRSLLSRSTSSATGMDCGAFTPTSMSRATPRSSSRRRNPPGAAPGSIARVRTRPSLFVRRYLRKSSKVIASSRTARSGGTSSR